ncbi:MAG: cyclodeaminase/cyclohydrolase family protein [Desulfobacterota bacterium]|nr:cyclodeaminase/cyclohydrolase family protein [Thermodesulfobacteriota bacterium]
MDIEQFLEDLASDRPTPGGGSASALAGALSAALVAMVAGLSLRKDSKNRKAMAAIQKKATALRKRLSSAMVEDARAFEEVMRAFQLPRMTEKERSIRTRAIEKAYRKATVTPKLVCEHSIRLLEASRFLIHHGNPNAISDTGVAAFLADAALAGGLLNIGINLPPVKDKAFLKKTQSEMRQWVKQRNRLMSEIVSSLAKIGR